ncbi:MAG TPA: TetR family transcriptional regulator [Bacteroidia bacterium]|nr:TetR family transcriptional regulator [Bacteroidia bacterium]
MSFNEKQVLILQTAEELFAKKGFEGTSVRDIADEAKVNVAMISYYFGSKEKLLESLFEYRRDSALTAVRNLLHDKQSSTMQKVYTLIDFYIDRIQGNTCFHRLMMREQVTLRPNTTKLIFDYKKQNQAMIEELIAEGQKKGEFKKHIEVPLMMATLVGTVSHVVTSEFYYREVNNLQHLSEEEFNTLIKKKLSTHLKKLFKAILTYEE